MYDILVVDDEYPIRAWLQQTIQEISTDYTVDTAKNGGEALEMLGKKHYHLILTDICMPRLDGLELMEEVLAIAPNIGVIVLSSYDNYDYVRSSFKNNAVDYLLKSEIDAPRIQRSIADFFDKQNISRAEEKITKGLLTILQEPERTAVPSQLAPYVPTGAYFSFLLKLNHTEESTQPFLPVVEHAQIKFCVPVAPNLYLGCVSFTTQPSVLIQLQTQFLYNTQLQKYNSVHLFVTTEIYQVSTDFPQRMQTLYRFRNMDFYGVHAVKGTQIPNHHTLGLNQHYMAVNRAIRGRDLGQILNLTARFFEDMQQEKYLDVDLIKSMCIRICDAMYLTNFMADPSEFHTSTQDCARHIRKSETCSALQVLTQQYISTLMEQLDEKTARISPKIKMATKIMEQRYMEELSLVMVANELHINAEYLSRLFKKEMSVNFVAYLSKIRLRHATELLCTTEKMISEISAQTGFQNATYFSKCFKQEFGVTPIEWKNSVTHTPDK